MRSRLALSALFILIAAMVLVSQGPGLLKKLRGAHASSDDKISEAHTLPLLDHSFGAGSQRGRAAGAISPDAKTISFNLPDATHCLGSRARRLQRFVLELIDSNHQGE